MIHLSQRLQSIADFVPPGSKTADIGTDHGFLPCYLAQQGQAVRCLACDINAQPLAVARKTIQEYGLEAQVETRLGNGLQVIRPGEVEVVTISGMGGSLMVDILEAAPAVVEGLKRLILQPNVAPETIRIWAEKNRWQIVCEDLVRENDRFYVVIVLEPGRSSLMTAVELLIGPKLLADQHPLLGSYVSEEWEKDQRVLRELEKSDREESREKAKLLQRQWEDINGVMKCQMGVNLLSEH